MILPNVASPLRPVLQAFYATSHELGATATPARYRQCLRQHLERTGQRVRTPAEPPLNLLVNERVGVVVCPATQGAPTHHQVRQALNSSEAPLVALILEFAPHPRAARVDAPLARQRAQRGFTTLQEVSHGTTTQRP